MTRLAQAWKAIVAFFAPGAALAIEPLLTAADFTTETLTRALIVGAVSSLWVYFKRNGPSDDPTTSTPMPTVALYDEADALAQLEDGRTILGTLGVALLVIAGVLTVTTLLGVLTVSYAGLLVTAGLGIVLMLVDGQ